MRHRDVRALPHRDRLLADDPEQHRDQDDPDHSQRPRGPPHFAEAENDRGNHEQTHRGRKQRDERRPVGPVDDSVIVISDVHVTRTFRRAACAVHSTWRPGRCQFRAWAGSRFFTTGPQTLSQSRLPQVSLGELEVPEPPPRDHFAKSARRRRHLPLLKGAAPIALAIRDSGRLRSPRRPPARHSCHREIRYRRTCCRRFRRRHPRTRSGFPSAS